MDFIGFVIQTYPSLAGELDFTKFYEELVKVKNFVIRMHKGLVTGVKPSERSMLSPTDAQPGGSFFVPSCYRRAVCARTSTRRHDQDLFMPTDSCNTQRSE